MFEFFFDFKIVVSLKAEILQTNPNLFVEFTLINHIHSTKI
jgi:hypothetical protein